VYLIFSKIKVDWPYKCQRR